MFEYSSITHHIQKAIIAHLMEYELARFRDMRPPKTDTNLYSYHLKLLLKQGYVEKTDVGYKLGLRGMVYADRVNTETVKLRPQPKIITMLVIQNDEGQVLVFKKKRQPFIGKLTLPYGKLHNDDLSVYDAAKREVHDKLGDMTIDELKHVGDTYIHIIHEGEAAMSTLVHIFYATSKAPLPFEHLEWVEPLDIRYENSAPGVVEVVQFALISKTFFFEEVTVELE